MAGFLCLILHAHLPFVRHPEHEKFLEETWLFEAITECYLPLAQVLEGWRRDNVRGRITLSLSPTLCSMLKDPVLQGRYLRHLDGLIELAEKETQRTILDSRLQELAQMYHQRLQSLRKTCAAYLGDLANAFAFFQISGQLEIITTTATHAVLPFLAQHASSLRAQILTARDEYQRCFGSAPSGIWLPECAYTPEIEPVLQEGGFRWFVLDNHGVNHATPRPRYGVYAPLLTRQGLAAFGRDLDSAKQVWSSQEGYPGDPRYRDFYRDVGYDLEHDYIMPYLASGEQRSYTGLKYYAITGQGREKEVYDRAAALRAAEEHATHFVNARRGQMKKLSEILDRPPVVVAPYDAELFGHWWYEGPEFLDLVVRKSVSQEDYALATPSEYLCLHRTHQVAQPAASSWGDGGYWDVWLNEQTAWIYPHLQRAQERMTELARHGKGATGLERRALQQAGRELLLAQASDWPFILKTGTSPGYARQQLENHLKNFLRLSEQLSEGGIDEAALRELENRDNLFPSLNYSYWE